MAKAAKTQNTTKETPAAPTKSNAGNRATVGTWDFTPKAVDEVPVGLGVTHNSQRLPFDWEQGAKTLDEGGKAVDYGIVPKAFWVEGRGVEEAKVTPQYVKDALYRSFHGWRSKDEGRKDHYAMAVSHQFEGAGEARVYTGTRLYLVHKTPAA